MENSKHTGGEWKVIPYNGYQQCIGTTNYTIAHTTIALEEKDKIQAEANAKLMAAAPDMLKALINAKREFERLKHEMSKPVGERDSFWISVFLKSAIGGQACMNEIDEVIIKATK